LYIDLSKSLK